MSDNAELPPHVLINRAVWTKSNAEYGDAVADVSWGESEISWGVWSTPESTVSMLPDVKGLDVIELGCGTGYFGSWLKRDGARRVVGIDITPAQLATAARLNAAFDRGVEFIEASCEDVPLEDAQFDLAISEYGASIWCDPERWIAEAARLLRPGGELVFLRNSTLAVLCMPDTGKILQTLQRQQRGMYRLEWADDDPGVEFHPGTSDMLHILQRNGFALVDMAEIYPPADATDHKRYDYVTVEWARQWPAEEIWRARLAR